MATQTTNYGLKKPAYTDAADISVINENMDVIDAKMKEIDDKAGSGGGGGSSVSYSTEEQAVGTWIDGKPMYQKTITVSNVNPSNGSASVPLGVQNIENIFLVSDGSVLYHGDSYARLTVPYSHYDSGSSLGVFFNISSNAIEFRAGTNHRYELYGYITVRYTKTTD